MRRRWMFLIPLIPIFILLFIFIGGEIVMHLWNWLLPPLFGWHQVTFWQAVGLLALCRILFGGLGRHGFYRSDFRRRMFERRRLIERWERMTPEERERFRQGLRGRCGYGREADEEGEPGVGATPA